MNTTAVPMLQMMSTGAASGELSRGVAAAAPALPSPAAASHRQALHPKRARAVSASEEMQRTATNKAHLTLCPSQHGLSACAASSLAEGCGLGQARRRRRRCVAKQRRPVLGGGLLRGVRHGALGRGGAARWLGGPAPQGGRGAVALC
jgi:hypothetical protein